MTFDDLLPYVLPHAPGCPAPTAEHHLRQAAIKFCVETLAWKYRTNFITSQAPATGAALIVTGDTLTTTDGEPVNVASVTDGLMRTNYAIALPTDAVLVKILRATSEGEKVNIVTPDEGEDMRDDGIGNDSVWSEDLMTVDVAPTPTTVGVRIDLKVALRPSETATTLPAEITNQHAQAIADGALAGLLNITGTTWRDESRALLAGERFERAIDRAGRRAAKGYGRGGHYVQPLNF